MLFLEIIKLQFEKKKKAIFLLLRIIVAYLFLKNAWLHVPPIFFLDFNSPCQDLLFPHSHKPHKNTSVVVGTFLNPLNPNSDQHQISPCNINIVIQHLRS